VITPSRAAATNLAVPITPGCAPLKAAPATAATHSQPFPMVTPAPKEEGGDLPLALERGIRGSSDRRPPVPA